ncbi:UvrD-helicase domain-containing protein [Methylocaldum sp. RMAD-M]|jgi:DNA helicase-2/ATP-dependent DNA helicase PcrA|uniref:UvrD-helicase domain-containing protein n=1 Tax=Methylocaldum sp. RMAD-M TaxID=2806557 RepID=UPI001AE6D575|nr:UvrD-helicase domain-containing protein [Methylocaldum sp. RMAD-M]MBP1152715.1 DNA helicase-2/ATP-dependent DNA helicase PcrA [Methylocaldum sp. RMAD-M]
MSGEVCQLRESVLACDGHALVLGGPGSGKTTLALRKTIKRIKEGMLPGQTALFLSFSRAAVARILDAARLEANKEEQDQLSIQTFHSFFWDILKAHAYLLGAPRKLTILLPQDEKALSGGLDEEDEEWDEWIAERARLFREDGRIAFDLFAPNAADLLAASGYLRSSIARRHPIIIVDEAQDTGQHAWRCIEMLAPHTQIICLADLEQQIFDYLPGVGPERVAAIRATLNPHEVDLGTQNHRSPDSEILAFGNDILAGKVRGGPYKGVSSLSYRPEKPPPNWNHVLRRALHELFQAVEAQSGAQPETIAILVSNNRSALKMSNGLNALGSYVGKAISHKLLFDEAEALLSARFAAFLLEPKNLTEIESDVATSMEMIAAAKSSTGQGKAAVAKLLEQANKIRHGKSLSINIANSLRSVISNLHLTNFTGDPAKDWLTVKHVLRATNQAELVRVASQLDFLVAFRRGDRISAGLASEWLRDGAYTNARAVLDLALAQEQILDGVEAPARIQIMNVHKAKGKQFDGVIVVREARRTQDSVESSFVWRGDMPPFSKSRRLLRVAVTRAKVHALILNPQWPSCPLLKWHKFKKG